MKSSLIGKVLVLVLLPVFVFASWTAYGAVLSRISPEDAKNIMPVSEIKRGMRGYGLTVFHGTKIERFDLEVLGVLKQMNTGGDLILVRIGGGPITKRSTGIIAGMSGSPCYINGKLIGAIAYGSGYAKEPIGMVTPIADMLEAWDEHLPSRPSGHSSPPADLPEPISVGGQLVRKVAIAQPGAEEVGVSNGVLHMVPLMTPVMVSGLSPRGIGRLAELLRPYGVLPMAGPGGKGKENVAAELRPGAAVGVSLARGDIDITAIGTLTYRRGNKILAFGHPMLGIGAIDAPLTTAFVDDLISSYRVSFKVASPLKTVGRIFQDRPWSVAGALGTLPKTIPVTVSIRDDAFNRSRTYRVDVINHPLLASTLLTLVVGEAIYESHPVPGDATAEVEYEVVADEVGKITRSNLFFDSTAVDSAAISDLAYLLRLLSSNRFYPLDVKSVNVKVRISGKRTTAVIDRIFVKEREYEPGETVDVGVVLRPYKQPRVTKTFSVKIPSTVPDGKLILYVRGGASVSEGPSIVGVSSGEGGATMAVVQPGSGSELASADNVKQLIEKYLKREKNNDIVVQLLTRSTTVNVAGEKLTGLPGVIADVMKSSRSSGVRLEREEVKKVFPTELVVFGSAQLSLDIKRRDLSETKTLPKPSSGVPGTTSDSSPPSSAASVDYEMVDDSEDYAEQAHLELAASGNGGPEAKPSSSGVEVEEKPAEKPSSDKPEVTGTQEKAAKEPSVPRTEVKTVVRQPKVWTQRTQSDFAKGRGFGVAVSSDGGLVLVPRMRKLVETAEQYVWCAVPGKDGSVYVGTGDSGKVYRVDKSGRAEVLYETGELEVHALAVDSKGNLYVGTSPNGKVFRIGPDGKGELIFDAEERYVLTLAVDSEDNLYVGVGDSGRVYRIISSGESSVFAELPEQQIIRLLWDLQGSLFVGTGNSGVVYRVDRFGKAIPVFDAPEESATALAVDKQGNLYIGTSPQGAIYKVSADGRSKAVFTNAPRVLSMVSDAHGNVYAACGEFIVRISSDEKTAQFDSGDEKVLYLCLAYDRSSDTLFAGTSDSASVYFAPCTSMEGYYESAVHDAQAVSRWGRIKWACKAPDGTLVEFHTRTGNSANPDDAWSPWSSAYVDASGVQITSPPARFIQYKAVMKATDPAKAPRVSSVSISYLPPNGKPKLTLLSPVGGEAWSGKKTIRWSGSDPDNDTLVYDVYYSSDGKNWQTLVGGLGTEKPDAVGSSPNAKTEEEITAKVRSELEKSKDVPEEMKKEVLKDVPAEKKLTTSGAPGQPSREAPTTSTSYTWDTTKVKDGRYFIKVVASDRPSNAVDALAEEVVSDPVAVCNTPPKVVLYAKKLEVRQGQRAEISGSASSGVVDLAGVQYRVDGGTWMAASSDDGIFDSPYEPFTIALDSLSVGTHKIEIQAVDTAGNAAADTVQVSVSAGNNR
ncbi:MAG: SpoIVB peptidase S55 domain-containing protein [Armatimonadota bacterium]|nr:SpoIVB peptidase S55 domain-containing protein [Armatimonadota bacterium]